MIAIGESWLFTYFLRNIDYRKAMTKQIIPETELQLLIVADNLLTRAGLAAVLEDHGYGIAGQSDGTDLSNDIDVFRPDIMVVDMGWHLETMRARLSAADVAIPAVILITGNDEDEAYSALVQTLAVYSSYGILLRDSDPETLIAAIHATYSRLLVIDPSLSSLLNLRVNQEISPLASPLTARENEVLQLLAKGMTNKAIALQLGITQHTVKFHVNAIMSKLDVQSRTEAVVRATQIGMIML